MIFPLFVKIGCPLDDALAIEAVVEVVIKAVIDGVVESLVAAFVEPLVEAVLDIDTLSEAMEAVDVCRGVSVVLGPLDAHCNGKTTLCV